MKQKKSAKRKIPISMFELLDVFGITSDEITHYLNIETGKFAIHSNFSGAFDENGNEIKEKNPFAGKKYIEIPGVMSYEAFRDMERFVQTVKDIKLQKRLTKILDGKGPFQHFVKYLSDFPEEKKDWEKFKKECIKKRAIEWLKDNNLGLES